MNAAYDEILSANADTRAGLFTTTAQRLGTTPQNAEKDFWVCWTLDALFNGREGGPRLLFKGGTSLSKAFGLIQRFSEDVDVTVFRDDLGQGYSVEELRSFSRKKRDRALNDIREACEVYINGDLFNQLIHILAEAAGRTGLPEDQLQVTAHPDDRQALRIRYPTATPTDSYIEKFITIESGAKSALDPHSIRPIVPYADADAAGIDLTVANVTVVDAERTFWDKVVILHGLRRWFEIRGELRGSGHRVSRHYYDLHELMASDVGRKALADPELGADCVAHAQLFYNRPDYDLASATPPTFALAPNAEMADQLRRDYAAMSGMIFGDAPRFDDILETARRLGEAANAS